MRTEQVLLTVSTRELHQYLVSTPSKISYHYGNSVENRRKAKLQRNVFISDASTSKRILDRLPQNVPIDIPISQQALRAYEFLTLIPIDVFELLDQLLERRMRRLCHQLALADIERSFSNAAFTGMSTKLSLGHGVRIGSDDISVSMPTQLFESVVEATKGVSPAPFDSVRDDARNHTTLMLADCTEINASLALYEWRERLLGMARDIETHMSRNPTRLCGEKTTKLGKEKRLRQPRISGGKHTNGNR